MIKLQIVGNLGKDCIVKEINGRTVINFNVAHTEKFKDATGTPKERTTWVECAYWTDRTAIAPYLKKGQMVYAEGSPEADGYLNKDNQPAATLRMRVRDVQLLGSRSDNNSGMGSAGAQGAVSQGQSKPMATPVAEDADDLPF